MFESTRRFLAQQARVQGRYTLTVLSLIGIGWIGHTSHWSMGEWSGGSEDADRFPEFRAPDSRDSLQSVPARTRMANERTVEMQESVIELAEVQQVRLHHEVLASASVEYDQHRVVEVSSLVSGTIFRIERFWGQEIKAGDVLAYIEAGEVGRAKGEFAKALFEKRTRDQTLQRLHHSRDSLPVRQIVEAEAASQNARVALMIAEQSLINLGFKLKSASFEHLAEEEILFELRWLGIADDAREELESTTSSSNLLPIRSPTEGIVIGRDASLGEIVSPERPFIKIADVRKMWIVLDIRKEDAHDVRLGQSITFDPDGNGHDVVGTISWISTEVDAKTRTLSVRAEVENPRSTSDDDNSLEQFVLRANMFGQGKVTTRQPFDGLAVSRDALHHIHGETVLFVQRHDQPFEAITVRTGTSVNGLVEITGDVQAGSKVAAKGSQLLKSDLILNRQLGLNR